VLRQPVAQQLLSVAVGVGDRREIGLGVDTQVGGAETAHGDLISGVGQRQCKSQVGDVR
jgi:hypothetical protein